MANWALINRLAKRRFQESLAEEAALFVLERLQEDDYRRVRSFSGRARFSTFLASLTHRLLEDFSRARFGRRRPPRWITALGGMWVTLFELLCLRRLRVKEAVEAIPGCTGEREALEEKAWEILERVVDCGTHQGQEVAYDDKEYRPESGTSQAKNKHLRGPEEYFMDDEKKHFLEMVFRELITGQEKFQKIEHSFARILEAGLVLSAEERLLLKLCYQDEMSVTRAGKMLGWNANQAHGKLRRLLARLQERFVQAGLDTELRTLLEG